VVGVVVTAKILWRHADEDRGDIVLTGESTPVLKSVDPGGRKPRRARRPHRHGRRELDRDPRPGRDGGHDGMATEIGQISGMLAT
jgi:hypothetical protein